MSRRPADHEIDRLLAALPRHQASAGFAERVLAELEAPLRPARVRVWLLAAAATLLVAALALWLAPAPPAGVAERPARLGADRTELLEEHRRMTEELASLKARLRAADPPPLYLGGDERLDLVLDLTPVLSPAAAPGEPRPEPVSRRTTNGGT